MTRARTPHGLALLALVFVLLGPLPTAGAAPTADPGEDRVLVYSHTAGFRHQSIPDGIAALQELGAANDFTVETSEDPSVFTDAGLAGIDAVVFLNTTGEVMTPAGRAAFERWVQAGGGWVGVHAAADTEYDWDFYGRLLGGAWFLAHPVQQPGVVVNEAPGEPSTAHLPDRWLLLLEEFYSFRANPRDHVRVLLSIDESTYLQDPNTTHLPTSPTFPMGESGVMGDHPMSWCLDVGAGRAWYSALGHEAYLYRVPEYRQHLLGGVLTALQRVDADCRVGATDGEPTPTPTPTASPAPDTGPTTAPPTDAPTEPAATPSSSPEPAGAGALPATGAGPLAGAGAVVALLALVRAGRARVLSRGAAGPTTRA